jgi:hypothetical protein
MSEIPLAEPPLDLLQAARDELVEGRAPLAIVTQSADPRELPSPPTCQRCDTDQRELVHQSAVLSLEVPRRPRGPKPR